MRAQLTLGELQARYAQNLQFHWLSQDLQQALTALRPTQPERPWIGTLATTDSPQIIVITPAQFSELMGALHQWEIAPHTAPVLLILSDAASLPTLPENALRLPCLYSNSTATQIIQTLAFDLAATLTATHDCHGVFLRVNGLGVLLSGEPGIGKSELALQLIQRGHALIADDAPIFYRSAGNRLTGICFPVVANFLEVRSLGLLNILAMYGHAAIAPQQELDLIIHLQHSATTSTPRRLAPEQTSRKIGGVAAPQIILEIEPGRPLVALVEALLQQYRLQLQGYDASLDFSERQLRWMEHKSL